MRKDHRPFFVKATLHQLNTWYVKRFIRPQFDRLGLSPMVVKPSSCEIHGRNIEAGHFLHLISHPQKPVRLTTWSSKQSQGHIHIGDYCLIAPGVELTSAASIRIGDNCMIASDCSVHDSDWHGLYNRTRPFRCTKPVNIGDNVWLGARTTVCKGVSIGENSVIGTGSIVTTNIPANVVAAGNPARVVKTLNPKRRMLKREFLFKKGDHYWENQSELDRYMCHGNTLWQWLKTLVNPKQSD